MTQAHRKIWIPSVVGVGTTDLGYLSSVIGKRNRSQDIPINVSWGGKEYIVGQGVERYARTIERMDFARLGEGVELQALLYATLAALTNPGELLTVKLMMGMPLEVMLNKALALRILKTLESWLLGAHTFRVNGDLYNINISAIQMAAQPSGAYLSWGLDDNGKWTRSKADLEATVVVCDQGFNTLDVEGFASGQILGRYTNGDTIGMRRAAETLIQSVLRQHKVNLSLHQADEFLRAEKPVLACADGDIDISTLVAQALDVATAGTISFLDSLWGNGRSMRYILFTGGGSAMLKESLLRHYPHGQVLPDPVMANALGLARYGRRIFRGAQTVIGLDPGFGAFKAIRLDRDAG